MTWETIPRAQIGEGTEEAQRLLFLVYSYYSEFQKLTLWNQLDHTDQQVPWNFLLGDGGKSAVRAFTQHAQGPAPSLIPPPLLNALIFCWEMEGFKQLSYRHRRMRIKGQNSKH